MPSSSYISRQVYSPPGSDAITGLPASQQAAGSPAASMPFPQPGRRIYWKRWLAFSALWAGIALLFTTQDYLILSDTERAASWTKLAAHKLVVWLLWGAISPLIMLFARRFPIHRPHVLRNLLLHIPAGVIFPLLNISLFILIGTPLGITNEENEPIFDNIILAFRHSFAVTFAIYAVTVVVVHALEFYRANRQRELIASQLEARLAEARLDVLRMQLQPHFLFNTLHSISALMEKDVSAARRMIARLSSLLRLSLENDAAQEIPLGTELEFLEQYIEIQRMRFNDRLLVDVQVAPEALPMLVPRLILQPLVENSIRHGITRHAQSGHIEITATVQDAQLQIMVQDNGPGLGAGPLRERVGIGNTRARLKHLYGEDHLFTVEDKADGGVAVTIIMPARPIAEEISTP